MPVALSQAGTVYNGRFGWRIRNKGIRYMTVSTVARTKYEAVIGLEVHLQLLTKTKIFCSCSTHFGDPPNSNVCPVCLGLPGALPVLNQEAVTMAMKAALALNCAINPRSRFARKNYFYPDLPKGYQISQFDEPLARDGWIEIEVDKVAQAHRRDARAHGRGRGQVAARGLSRIPIANPTST